jgi:hypothetical protein
MVAARPRGVLACTCGTSRWAAVRRLVDSPNIFCGVAEFAAGYAGTKVEVADSNAVILQVVRKVIAALCHGSNKDCYALVLVETLYVVAYTHHLRVEAECDFAAVGWKMIGDGVLDNLDELFLGRRGTNLVSVEQLYHETSEALKCSGDADRRADSDEHVLVRLDVYLEPAGLVDGRIEESKETLTSRVSGPNYDTRCRSVYTPDG